MSGSYWNPDDALAAEVDHTAGVIPGTTSNADPWRSGVAGSAGVSAGTGTGQHGTIPIGDSNMDTSGLSAVFDWLNTPFQTPMSKTDVFVLIGTILVGILAWNFILYHIRIAAEAI